MALTVFDEPEAGAGLWSLQNLIQVFEDMRPGIAGSSILIIFRQERILNIADEVIVLRDGRMSAQGEKDDILPGLVGTPSAVPECRGCQGVNGFLK